MWKQAFADFGGRFGQIEDGLDGPSPVQRTGAKDHGAVGYGFGERLVDSGFAEEVGCADGGFCFHPILSVGGDDAQPVEAEVGHGACRGADVERVARGDQDYVHAVALGGG